MWKRSIGKVSSPRVAWVGGWLFYFSINSYKRGSKMTARILPMLLFRLKMVWALEASWTTNNKPVKNYFYILNLRRCTACHKKTPSKLILNTTQDRPSTIETYSSANTTITWTHHFTIVKQQYCKLFVTVKNGNTEMHFIESFFTRPYGFL